jgi:hypothetical protein
MAQYYMFHQVFFFHNGSHYKAIAKDKSFRMDSKVLIDLGKNQVTIHGCTDLDFTSLGH